MGRAHGDPGDWVGSEAADKAATLIAFRPKGAKMSFSGEVLNQGQLPNSPQAPQAVNTLRATGRRLPLGSNTAAERTMQDVLSEQSTLGEAVTALRTQGRSLFANVGGKARQAGRPGDWPTCSWRRTGPTASPTSSSAALSPSSPTPCFARRFRPPDR